MAAKKKSKRGPARITSGEPWADCALSDLTDAPDAEWQALLDHAVLSAKRSKPSRKWLAEAAVLIEAIGDRAFAATLTRWLERTAELPAGADSARHSFQLMDVSDNGDILRGLVWSAGPRADGALVGALGRAARAFATKVPNIGQRSTRVTNACITALAEAAARSHRAVAELFALQWAIDYPSTRTYIDRTIKDVGQRLSLSEQQLRSLGAGPRTTKDVGKIADPLARALEALSENDPEQALTALLSAWRSCKAQLLAELIERLSSRLTGTEAASLRKKTQKATLAAWIDRAKERRPADVGILIDPTLFPLGRDWRKAHRQLEQLASFNPDPRVAAALTDWLLQPPFDSAASRKAWQLVFEELVRHDDPRTVERLQGRDDFTGLFNGSYSLRDWIGPTIKHVQAQLTARHPSVPSLPPECDAVYRGLRQALVDPREVDPAQLLDEIHANPADDELRLVYADLLQQAGDPRGELITLQMQHEPPSRQRRARERELLRLHGRAWLGDLEPALAKTGLVFRRGFPAEGRLSYNPAALKAVVDHPDWSTFEVLDLKGWTVPEVDQLVLRSGLPSLYGLRGVPLELARRLCLGEDQKRDWLEVLEVHAGSPDWSNNWLTPGREDLDDLLQIFASCPGLPRLRRLGLSCAQGFIPEEGYTLFHPTDLSTVLEGPVTQRLDSLVVTTPEFEPWLDALPGTATHLATLELREYETKKVVCFKRDAGAGTLERVS